MDLTLATSAFARWNHSTRTEPAWLVKLAAESDALYQVGVGLTCLFVIVLVAGFFWMTSLSTQK